MRVRRGGGSAERAVLLGTRDTTPAGWRGSKGVARQTGQKYVDL